MNIVKEGKWQRVRYMIAAPLGEDRYYMTGCKEHIALARAAAAEGMVLLKNEQQVLPLAEGAKVAVFGKGCADYVKGGGGSGSVNPPYSRSLLDGLAQKEAEGKLECFQPLTQFYSEYVGGLYAAGKLPGRIGEPELPDELVKQAREFTDVAVISISRHSGEGADRTGAPHDGDFYLSLAEEAMVEKVLAAFDKVVVVLNTGGMMDTLWFKDEPRICSALLAWQPGMEGGNAMADILCGDVCPSGRLTDTFAVNFDAYPTSETFNESEMFVEYQEDIFVGYRYFETIPGAAEKVCYPFGYGLSYTTFQIADAAFVTGTDGLTFTATVKNTGKRAGKQVVQLYCQAPQGKLGKAARVLIGFTKTDELAPGAETTVTIEVPLSAMASFDDVGAVAENAYVLEAGAYRFHLGENVRKTQELAQQYVLSEDVVLEQLSAKCVPQNLTRRMKADGTYEETGMPKDSRTPFAGDPELPVHGSIHPPREYAEPIHRNRDFTMVFPQLSDVYAGKITLDELMDEMSDEQMIHILCGQPNRGPANTFGWGNLEDFGVPNCMTADGPAGLRFRVFIDVKTTNFPCANMMACTWNPQLLYQIGKAAATEVRENGCGIWLAPAANIHRSPLCGRNFEYYSEDPLISGKMAAAVVAGTQSMGVAASLKHFAANNKETNRKDSNSILSQRALREIYLKAFEICVKEADPWSVMSSYNLINGVHASSNRELLTDILRGEWGFNGLVTTDWWTTVPQYEEIAAGNDVKMGTGMPEHTLRMLRAGKLKKKDLRISARRVLELILKLA